MPPPPLHTQELFLFPTSSYLSWATVLITTLVVIDVSTELGEYHEAVMRSDAWGGSGGDDGGGGVGAGAGTGVGAANTAKNTKNLKNHAAFKKDMNHSQHSQKNDREQRLRDARKAINIAALQVILLGLLLIALSSTLVMHLTKGIDGRMIYVLEGISRLEAAHLMGFISVKTPRWMGVYASPTKERRRIRHVGRIGEMREGSRGSFDIRVLKFHVRYSIGEYFGIVLCLALPFTGRPLSMLVGFTLGFLIEGIIIYGRRGNDERRLAVSSTSSLLFTFLASVMGADGCHYIQVVWGSGLYFSEWGLGIASFSSFFAWILLSHFWYFQLTLREYLKDGKARSKGRRGTQHEKLALSLIRSHLFGSLKGVSERQLLRLEKELENDHSDETMDDRKVYDEGDATQQSTWSLFKQRLFSRSDLIMLTSSEYATAIVISLLSLFVVIVNIGATWQMNVVRQNFHRVHDALYGTMDQGPVCAFDKISGTIQTFPNNEAALAQGYTVAHCGACGHCSSWPNLRLQYTTRTYLAKESARCARKSLLFGPEAVHQCLQQEPIGFTDSCAQCWTTDIMCARANCAFIFLQSNMINTVSNFQVDEDVITAATCEEAMCELEFVPCSGANRRRMNIQSTIARPGRQLCGIVDVDWEEVFGEGGSFYPVEEMRHDEL